VTRGRIVLAGAVAQRPGVGGHTWVYLQYLLGLRALGWEVLLLDSLPTDEAATATYLVEVMERFGLADAYSVLLEGTSDTVGRSRGEALEHVRDSAVLINVMGYLDDEELLGAAPMRAFLDIDPGFGQMWRALGLADVYPGHDAFVTVGENIGAPDCAIPTCGIDWITTPQPVVLDQWTPGEGLGTAVTSVGAWRGPYGPIEYEGRTYGLRVHEFRRFLDLPRRTGEEFEVALDIHAAEGQDIARLEECGWRLADPRAVAGTPEAYRDYVRGSAAELMIAKNMYVDTNSGWFSERSICYLAAGRPVLAQDTGIRRRFPEGEGLLPFSDVDEACARVEELKADPARHRRAAREIAEAHFSADVVLPRLLAELGVS
jgi:hypothetical protein